MTQLDTQQLSETIGGLKEAAANALAHQSADDFEAFERYLSEVDGYVREVQQSLWANDARGTLRRLEKNEPLNQTDREVLQTFLISDARSYLKHENNFEDWVSELERLVDGLDKRVNTTDRNSIADVRGILKDAIRLVPDIRNYLEEQRRVERFDQAITSLDQTSRDMLVRVLKEQLRSEKR